MWAMLDPDVVRAGLEKKYGRPTSKPAPREIEVLQRYRVGKLTFAYADGAVLPYIPRSDRVKIRA
jgi:hypothetical protein